MAKHLIGLLCLLAIAATALAEEKSPLEGTWVATSAKSNGEAAPDEVLNTLQLRFVGEHLYVRGNSSKDEEAKCTFALDETKNPKHLTFTPPELDKPVLGIYKRDGTNLTVCIRHANSDKGRPTEFKSTPDSQLVLVVFELKEE